MVKANFHEDFRRGSQIKGSSDRIFGVLFALVFAVVGLWPLLTRSPPLIWWLAVAAAFLLVAIARPRVLRPLNKVWFQFGLLIHQFTNPVIMGFIFYLAVTPTALVMRALGKDPLRRRFDKQAKSYWIERRPPGPSPKTMQQQF